MRISVFLAAFCAVGCTSAPDPAPDPLPPPGRPEAPPQEETVAAILSQEAIDERAFLQLVTINNPKVRAAERDIEAAGARSVQAGLWPNPTAFGTVEEAPPSRIGDGKQTIGLSTPIILGGRLGAAVDAADRERDWIEAATAGLRRDLVAQARLELYRYVQTREVLAAELELQRIAAAFKEAVAKRREEKSVLEVDFLKTSVQLSEQEIAADLAERESQKSAVRIRSFTGVADFDVGRLRVELPKTYTLRPLAAYEAAAFASHPLIRAAEANLALANARHDLASSERWPDLALSAAYGRTAGEDSSGRDSIVEFGISVPLPLFNRNQGRLTEAEILRRKALIQVEDARLEVRTRLLEAYREAGRQLARLSRYQDAVLSPASKTVEQVSLLYREGKALVIEVLDAQRVLASSRRALLDARFDLAAAIISLESVTGESR